ncbi:uncharacterized protein LOC127150405 [Cucumis melo]|uniref:Uncharacterized protein LOC127150405 n=1 Tax=Cucumis melo TaxID=3656 RepID=A0ABM3L207_CUCME|nr:uncharacterized protein LOC127150405 [Cucumis melo]
MANSMLLYIFVNRLDFFSHFIGFNLRHFSQLTVACRRSGKLYWKFHRVVSFRLQHRRSLIRLVQVGNRFAQPTVYVLSLAGPSSFSFFVLLCFCFLLNFFAAVRCYLVAKMCGRIGSRLASTESETVVKIAWILSFLQISGFPC